MSPIAPALWIAGMAALLFGLIDYTFKFNVFDPVIAIVFYLFAQELSKFVAELTMDNNNGSNSNS
jgi:hypothetical protein